MKVAVLMTVHNRREKTLSCLERLSACPLPGGSEVDVFMTDDGSDDGTAEVVRERFPEVRIIPGDGNLYWNRGMIRAWEVASEEGDYDAYLWLNDDTLLYNGALRGLITASEKNPEAVLVGGTCSDVSGEVTYGGIDTSERTMIPDGSLRDCVTMNGNIVLVPRNVYNELGTLDPAFSHSLGDVDYGRRARKAGFTVLLLPDFCGTCERNSGKPKWTDPAVPVARRLRLLWHPLSYSRPPEYFRYKRRHWGLLTACLAMCSTALHVLSPRLWNRLKHKN